jgi:serine/threonine-protein kinase
LWVRRHPALAVAAAGALLLAVALAGGGWWWAAERAALERAVEGDLREMAQQQHRSSWPEARAALGRARARLGDRGPAALRRRLDQGGRDLELAARLDAIRLNRGAPVEGRVEANFNRERADREYESAFREAGLGEVGAGAGAVAARVESSPIKAALLAALDEWAVCAADKSRRDWVLDVARRADPDPAGWRDRARDPRTWDDPAALVKLAGEAPAADESVALLLGLGERLLNARQDATALLKKVRRARPSDFWANFSLALALYQKSPADSVRYFQAAAALRPGAVVALGYLGLALRKSGQTDEAVDCLRQAVRLAPTDATPHANLGRALAAKGLQDEAVQEYRQAIALEPQSVVVRANLGLALLQLRRVDAALDELRQAVRVDAACPLGHNALGIVLQFKGRSSEALAHFREAVRLDPELSGAHMNLGLALKALGQLDEAVAHCERAVRLEPQDANYHFSLGLVLKAAGRRDEAVEQYEQALQINPKLAAAHLHTGVILAERRRTDEAISRYQRAIKVNPKYAQAYAALGDALLLEGRLGDSLTAIRRCVELLPKKHPSRAAAERHLEGCKVLIALEGRLPAVLLGRDRPAHAGEGLQFAKLCRGKKRYAAAARLAAEAFARAPALARDLRTHERYEAACASALAGCGLGEDAAELSSAERARWREQARGWLRADLVAWARQLEGGSAAGRHRVQSTLTRWRADPYLAGLREPGALDRLSADERKDCLALWDEVAAVLTRAREPR